MKFKIDENLPVEFAELLTSGGHEVLTVVAQGLQGEDDRSLAERCLREQRILITLDLDFADIRAYPPQDSPGFIVIRASRQDRDHVTEAFQRAMPLIGREPLEHHLWIVEETRIRIRGAEAEED